ncbi:MAG: glycoside hydrolase family 3 N-terminal domain-containing protein [Bacillota bacterium]|jgi:beta-glucosidase|nr:glycoside hydrolase family 3 N-terminal domain-containing protein [Bacillota bacterium]
MKKVSVFLVAVMLISMLPGFSLAETPIQQADVKATVKPIIEVDGFYFKDLNANGKLDVYEDWRADIDDRIADLIDQMTLEEEVGLLFCNNTAGQFSGTYPVTYNYLYRQDCPFEPGEDEPYSGGYSAWYYINVYHNRCFLDNANGTPEEQVFVHNEIQKMCEETRLGIPMTFTSDREYNSWGGFIDKPHDAFGVANDPELAVQLLKRYAQSMKSVGVHVTFEPYGNEIGSFNGEDPEYIAKMTELEVATLNENGLATCTKHWIGRGGDSSFQNARSVAQNVDNWMEGWKAAVNAGTPWIMTNSGATGLTNTVPVEYDRITMSYLRDTLGFDGIIVTDWWALGQREKVSGVTPDGVELSELNGRQLYKMMLENGVDIFGTVVTLPGEDIEARIMANYPDCIINGVRDGEIPKELVDRAATRILRFKFELGLFENPYSDAEEAIALCANSTYHGVPLNTLEEYLAAPRLITNNEELRAVRNLYDVALGEEMQAASAVLVKNENDLLPLKQGTKVYVEASSEELAEHYARYIANYGVVVDTIEEADVVVGDFSRIDDNAEMFVEDAQDAGKPIVLTLNCLDPNEWAIQNSNALLYLSFNQRADHGAQLPGFITTTEPWIYADLLFGVRQPRGMIVKEITRSPGMDAVQWKDLAGDQGASDWVRLMLQATMKTSPTHTVPENWGDPLICYKYGMRYGMNGEFVYETLVLPVVVEQREVMSRWGGATLQSVSVPAKAKVGEPYTVHFLLWNHGADDMVNVQAFSGEQLLAEKLMAVNGGSWRVVAMDLVFDTPGEHEVTIGDLTANVVVE